jgi:hypothetical protein
VLAHVLKGEKLSELFVDCVFKPGHCGEISPNLSCYRSVALLCKIKEWNQEPSYAAKVKIIWESDIPECRYRLPR